jgi:hypothetical protein
LVAAVCCAAVGVGVGGCATSARIGLSPTVDSNGKWGAAVILGLALGDTYRHGTAAILVSADLRGAVDERARARGNSGDIALGLGLDALGESPSFGFRMGLTLAGRAILPTGAPGAAVGARLALLPVIHSRHAAHTRCGESESWTYWHLGLELSAQYLSGPDARGLFAAGPIFELDTLAHRVCD